MKYLIDSNIWIYALGNVPEAVNLLSEVFQNNNGGYSFITKIEVLGYNKINSTELYTLRAMLNLSDVIKMTDGLLEKTIDLRQKYTIKTPDAIIAATALLNDLILVTRNIKDFDQIKNLTLLNPFET